MPAVLSDVLWSTLVLILMVTFAWRVIAPIGAIWRGETARVPRLVRLHPQARTYLPFSLWIGMLCAGMCVLCVCWLMDGLGITHGLSAVGRVGIGVMTASFPLMLVNVIVWAFNRPRLFVVPTYRNHPGAVGVIRARMRRGRVRDQNRATN